VLDGREIFCGVCERLDVDVLDFELEKKRVEKTIMVSKSCVWTVFVEKERRKEKEVGFKQSAANHRRQRALGA